MNLNKVYIAGNLTRDPELRYTPNGTAVCNVRLAINRKYKSGDEWKDEVCFLSATAWGKTAENCNQYLVKGSPVFIEGRLQSRSWDGPDGKKRFALDVVVERIQFLGGKKKDEQEETTPEWLPEDTQDAESAS